MKYTKESIEANREKNKAQSWKPSQEIMFEEKVKELSVQDNANCMTLFD